MDYTGVLKRAWSLVRHYRALWFFGIILALVTAGGSAPNNRGIQYTFRNEDLFGGRPLRL